MTTNVNTIPFSDLLRLICDCPGAEISLDRPVRDTPGWDSMRAVNFQMEIETAYGVDLSDVEITGCSTPRRIEQLLREQGVVIIP